MGSYSPEFFRIVGKDLYEIAGYFSVDAGSALLVGATTQPASGLVVTLSKPAGTGIYRLALLEAPNDVFYAGADALAVAGTLDRCMDPVAKNLNSQGFVSSVDFQCRKKSDGTAVDPVSLTFFYQLICKRTALRP